VPPVAASVVGSRFRINLLLATGGAVSTDTSGIAGVIELGLMAGDAFEAQNGLNESIELGLTTGEAFGGITGLHESIELVLDAGAAIGDVQVGGVAEAIELALTTGPGSVASAPGIDEAVDLVLVGGAAEEVVPSGPTDPDFASVSLLLPFDGADGSTTFTDVSSNSLTVTAVGDAEISTAQSKWGTGSLRTTRSTGGVSLPSSSVLQLDGDFTVEFWIYALQDRGRLVKFLGSIARMDINQNSTAEIGANAYKVYLHNGGVELIDNVAIGLVKEEWHHVALTRSGTTLRLFGGGTLYATRTHASTFTLVDICRTDAVTSINLDGHIDDFRVTKGIARYTANFTPPTAAFPTS
jgi:hypothetical protein